jgi:hypothetical protein
MSEPVQLSSSDAVKRSQAKSTSRFKTDMCRLWIISGLAVVMLGLIASVIFLKPEVTEKACLVFVPLMTHCIYFLTGGRSAPKET